MEESVAMVGDEERKVASHFAAHCAIRGKYIKNMFDKDDVARLPRLTQNIVQIMASGVALEAPLLMLNNIDR